MADPDTTEPGKSAAPVREGGQADPESVEPGNIESGNIESGNIEPGNTDPGNSEIQQVELEKIESENAEPGRAGPEGIELEKTGAPQGVDKKRPLPGIGLWTSIVVIVLVVSLGATGFWFWIEQQRGHLQAELALLGEQIQQQQTHLQALRTELREELQKTARLEQQQSAAVTQTLSTVQQRLESHNKRLLSLSSTDRDDWRLAEAEYLLQLANQRLLIENDSRNAEELLAAADNILMELQDVDLFVVREGISRDLTALKLTPKIDREGIYLRLAALAAEVHKLAVVPSPPFAGNELKKGEAPGVEVENTAAEPAAVIETGAWLEVVKQHFVEAFDKFSEYIRVTDHDAPLEPILPPDGQSYLQQNLRFMLERAQLALMRQEQVIYAGSIQQARDWLQTYYALPRDGMAARFDRELNDLQQISVVLALPDISQSLEQLQAYIERLHKLAPAASDSGEADG